MTPWPPTINDLPHNEYLFSVPNWSEVQDDRSFIKLFRGLQVLHLFSSEPVHDSQAF